MTTAIPSNTTSRDVTVSWIIIRKLPYDRRRNRNASELFVADVWPFANCPVLAETLRKPTPGQRPPCRRCHRSAIGS
jgi:hypothetical protein